MTTPIASAQGQPTVPTGFRARIFASGFTSPTAIAFGPDRRLYVAQQNGTIDVVAKTGLQTIVSGFATILGLGWHNHKLYVGAAGSRSAAIACAGFLLVGPFMTGIGAAASPAAVCRPVVSRLSAGLGQPDDLGLLGGHILFGDLKADDVAEIVHGRPRILVRNLNVPEGIVVENSHRILLVEQGLNRIDSIDLNSHRRAVLLHLVNNTANEGIDQIHQISGALIVPNSPNGTILRFSKGRLKQIAKGLTRPTDVTGFNGGIAIADEYGHAIWLLKRGHLTKLASVPTPDDVTTVSGMLLTVTLGDGGLWEIRPRVRRLLNVFNQPQGLETIGGGAVALASQNQNVIDKVTFPAPCFR
jgi:hypothetical protein